MKKLLVILSLVAASSIFSSCGPTRYTVTEQPAPPVYERPVSPGPAYVWVDGHWTWRGGRYVYTNGYWAHPRGRRAYVTGTWVHVNKGYYWKRGYWR